ncbi:hypothetical protein EV421DRAFT_1729640 [Armillaria borealis]|uniref:Uncharacterized protein n=1 Tax=Armillaria borealis TaxID=47425 RepID=A0AA39K6Q3_9AGAR|nr:hypothetical protein EV421DRAFT_1729640 [Armillaria borealis]
MNKGPPDPDVRGTRRKVLNEGGTELKPRLISGNRRNNLFPFPHHAFASYHLFFAPKHLLSPLPWREYEGISLSSVSEYKPLIGATGGGLATLVVTFELRRFYCPVMKFVHCHRLRKTQEGHMIPRQYVLSDDYGVASPMTSIGETCSKDDGDDSDQFYDDASKPFRKWFWGKSPPGLSAEHNISTSRYGDFSAIDQPIKLYNKGCPDRETQRRRHERLCHWVKPFELSSQKNSGTPDLGIRTRNFLHGGSYSGSSTSKFQDLSNVGSTDMNGFIVPSCLLRTITAPLPLQRTSGPGIECGANER